MKITIEKDVFAEQVAWVLRCVSARATLPALGGLLLEARGEGLRMAGTDLELSGETSAGARVEEPGRAVVPGRVLGEIARSLPQGVVRIEAGASETKISCGSAEFALRLLPVEDIPALQFVSQAPGGTLERALFQTAVGQVTRAASRDEARPVLTGTLVEADAGKLMLVATDSYRLAVREIAWKGPSEPVRRVIPARALQEAARGAEGEGELQVLLGESQAVFAGSGRRLGTRLIEGEFPNWRQLVPGELPNRLRVKRDDFIEAVRRVGILAQSGSPVRVELSAEGVQLAAGTQDIGQASERVEGTYEGEPVTVSFNPQYLLDGVQAVEGNDVVLSVRDGQKPVLIRGADDAGGFTYLAMPIRVGG
ncbi:MAG: DNA polymerase III subunit beta [Acidobacteria bacterium]|nr:DNA polymerase III subunit beta [Acidobacteriota bacterium]